MMANISVKSGYCWTSERNGHSSPELALYAGIVTDIKQGDLGPARIATEIRNQYVQAYNGRRDKMTKKVASTRTIVPATYISFCRDCEKEVIVAGKDLCGALGFLTQVQQKKPRTVGGVDGNWMGPSKTKQAYVMSKETKAKIAINQWKHAEAVVKVRLQGTMYVGGRAMADTKLVQCVKEPLMKSSFITTACLASASSSATLVDD